MLMCDLLIERTYLQEGTNGVLYFKGKEICKTIELPWRENQPNLSCIPEGRYPVTVRETEERGLHLLVNAVPGRSKILIHPANFAIKELRGCIAPVSFILGEGKGVFSRKAMDKLLDLVLKHLLHSKFINLLIISKS